MALDALVVGTWQGMVELAEWLLGARHWWARLVCTTSPCWSWTEGALCEAGAAPASIPSALWGSHMALPRGWVCRSYTKRQNCICLLADDECGNIFCGSFHRKLETGTQFPENSSFPLSPEKATSKSQHQLLLLPHRLFMLIFFHPLTTPSQVRSFANYLTVGVSLTFFLNLLASNFSPSLNWSAHIKSTLTC